MVRKMTKLYKNKYIIAFYDKQGERFKYSFDNIRAILHFMNKSVTRQNINVVNNEIYKALKTSTHLTRFLTGEPLTLYIIDITEDDD